MKKSLFLFLIISFLFVGCTKTIKVDSFSSGKGTITAYTYYDNNDGMEYEYDILRTKKIVFINHYPRKTTVKQPSEDSHQEIHNAEIKEILYDGEEIKSVTVGNMKFVLK